MQVQDVIKLYLKEVMSVKFISIAMCVQGTNCMFMFRFYGYVWLRKQKQHILILLRIRCNRLFKVGKDQIRK